MGRIEDALRKLEQERRAPSVNRSALQTPVVGVGHVPLRSFSLSTTTNQVTLDSSVLKRWGPVVMLDNDERAKREYGQIKRPIINLALGRTADSGPARNVVLVTSALAGEGKSLTSLNLAMSIAREKDLAVVLIDADFAKLDLSRTFGLGDANGLADLVASDTLQLDDVLWKTSVEGLFFVPAGRRRSGSTELVGSQRMRHIVDSFVHDLPRAIVIIDSSPLLLTNEAPTLVSLAGQIVLVVRANETPHLVVADALSRLEPGKPIGLVLNGANTHGGSYYSGTYNPAAPDQDAHAAEPSVAHGAGNSTR